MKKTLAAMAIAGLVMAPVVASAADMDPPPTKDPVQTVGCGIVTIIMLPVIILGGNGPNC